MFHVLMVVMYMGVYKCKTSSRSTLKVCAFYHIRVITLQLILFSNFLQDDQQMFSVIWSATKPLIFGLPLY